jgi:flagellar hook-associated protein 2
MCEGGNRMLIGSVPYTGSTNRIASTVSAISPVLAYKSKFTYQQATGSWLQSSSNAFEQMAKSAAAGIANFLKEALKVQTAANKWLNKDSSSIQARETGSSDITKVTAKAGSGASLNSYQIKVHSIAESQMNSGTNLNKNSVNGIQSGTNQLKITIGGKSTKVSSNILSSDTNDQALNKLKNVINSAKTGVTASVVTNADTGTSKLELKSDKTGTDQVFSISDEVGNAAETTGITSITSTVANASYSVNGAVNQTSQSNTIDLEKGKVTATFLKPTSDAVKIDVHPDEKKALEQVGQLISNYNTMHNRLKEAGGYLNPSVNKRLENAVSSSSYEQIGIKKNGDGTLKLDEAKFKQSLSANYEQTNRALTGNKGLATSLEKETDRFNDISASALLNQKMQAMQQFATYQSTQQSYLQIPTTGLLINGIF